MSPKKNAPTVKAGIAPVLPYSGLARVYDWLMEAVDYDGWLDYVEAILKRLNVRPSRVFDLACGTGTAAIALAQRGYQVLGVDLSGEMLQAARIKASRQRVKVDFLEADLRSFQPRFKGDLALLFQDGLNYLNDEDELFTVFRRVFDSLNPGGALIFDLTYPGFYRQTEGTHVSWAEESRFTLIWETSYSKQEMTWDVLLTVFYREEDNCYRKFQEHHREREFERSRVIDLLRESGFTFKDVFPTFSFDTPGAGDPKLTFAAIK